MGGTMPEDQGQPPQALLRLRQQVWRDMPDVIATRVGMSYYQPPTPDSPIFPPATPIEAALVRDPPAQDDLTKIIEHARAGLIEDGLLTGEELDTLGRSRRGNDRRQALEGTAPELA